MSTQRWWAPQRATLEPDAVVLALLKPDDNGESDLGTTLLAAHRAGAAACEAVAKGAVPSEAGLITSLATARQNLSEHMVDAVSKSMEATYAGLLVRDVLDEAEQGAVDLFRTAVAKGVSPPLAAQRAGAVYGVPFRQLGTYAALAVDPKTNPVALTDAADRTLLGYFAKVAQSEDSGQVVTFSKAPAAHTRPMAQTSERWEEHEHPRGPDGKFVNAPPTTGAPVDEELASAPAPGSLAWVRQKLGLDSNAPARVADVRTPAPTRAPQREPRVARQARTARVARTAREPQRTAPQQRKLVRTKPERTLSRKEISRALDRIDNGRLDRALEQSARSGALSVAMTPDLLKLPNPASDAGNYRYLDLPVSVVASGAVAEALRMRMIDQAEAFNDTGTRIFRMGHLLGQAAGQHEATSETESKASIETAAEQAWDLAQHPPEAHMAEAAAPDIETVHPDDIEGNDMSAFLDYLERKKHEAATKVLPGGRRVLDAEELQHVHVLEDYRPLGTEKYDEEGRLLNDTDYHIVHYRSTDPHNPHLRAMPAVDEFVILNSARGSVEGVGQHVEIELDPNQAYQVMGRAEKFFDAENQVIVRRWHLTAVEEDELDALLGDIEKALEAAQAVVFEQLHPRDEDGRFAPASERTTLVAPTATPTRQARTARTTRQARTARTLERQAAPAALPRRQLARTKPERAAVRSEATRTLSRELLARREALRRPTDPDLPELSDARTYKVMSDRHLAHVLDYADGDLSDLETPGQSITVYGPGRRILAEHSEQRVESLKQRLAMNVDEQLVQQGSIATKVLGSISASVAPTSFGMAQAISDAFERHPDVDQIELVRHGDRLHLYGNSTPVKHQVIIEHDFDVDWDAPIEIELIGEYRARDIVMSTTEGRETLMSIDDLMGQGGEGVVPNPSVQLFRITSPKVRRYRAGNA